MDTTYLNHAGTSWPKPGAVLDAAHSVSDLSPTDWPVLFETAHQTVADFFHVEKSRLLLTPSCTAALDLAVMDHAWSPDDRVITSGYEHHALHRTMVKLSANGVRVTELPRDVDELISLAALETELKSGGVRLVALTAACNVTGRLLPVAEVIRLAHQHGALALIDGAQVAGWWDLDLSALGADLFTFAGHKGPQAPWGIGGLFVAPQVSMNSPAATCEVPAPGEPAACATMPGYCDAGSVNLSALAGLAAACEWLTQVEQQDRLHRARRLAGSLTDALREIPAVTIHDDVPMEKKMPTVAVSWEDWTATALANALREQGVITSGGFQCAPQTHQALGTSANGVVRFSFGPRSQETDVAAAVEAAKRLGG